MSQTLHSDATRGQHNADERKPEYDLELWKHFAGMGGTDKNTMITTVSWLLAFAAAAIWYIVTDTQMIGPIFPNIYRPGRMMVVSLLGVLCRVCWVSSDSLRWIFQQELGKGRQNRRSA